MLPKKLMSSGKKPVLKIKTINESSARAGKDYRLSLVMGFWYQVLKNVSGLSPVKCLNSFMKCAWS